MSTPFQNRLVGTVIVAAAVIIFLPDILDGEKETYQADFEAIPEAPAFQGAQEHKAFPEEKLNAIPTEQLSDEEAQDDLLAIEQATDDSAGEPNTSDNQTTQVVAVKKEPVIAETASKVVETTSKPPKPLPPVAKEQNAWVIHLGSFKHQKNVDDLMRKLKAGGYTAFTQPIKTQKGTLTKVIVGPSLNKAELQKNIPELKKLTKVQGRLAKFKVTK
ncbi:SPOR domain-containing protein [Thalassotalea euphylliae]|uniref:SPOR domain-containing protein n=1 Tax=Thalassotalea euphylliae TaxID=1655234 RepID=UPI00362F8D73